MPRDGGGSPGDPASRMRRSLVFGSVAAAALARPAIVRAGFGRTVKFGLTPVFLTNDLVLLDGLRKYLAEASGFDVELVQRKTYQEIVSLLVSDNLDLAWICGYPFVAFRDRLELVAVPQWRGRPLYSSYLVITNGRIVKSLSELRDDIHAFSDPDSNSGYLVTCAALMAMGQRPEQFFRRSIFTHGHRNVVRAVGSGLAMSGSVDGYVWEVLAETEPQLTARTRIIARSEPLGFPPIACNRRRAHAPELAAVRQALLAMGDDPLGKPLLDMLRLDGFVPGEASLFDGIAEMARIVRSAT